ncbi:MAG: hypothetical protein P8J29_02865 [Rhodospirillales bacterium]|nr:hypothetical protein [Rhodospirillales bacterium]
MISVGCGQILEDDAQGPVKLASRAAYFTMSTAIKSDTMGHVLVKIFNLNALE